MNKSILIGIILVLALAITGFVVYKTMAKSHPASQTSNSTSDDNKQQDQNEPQNTDIAVNVVKTANIENTITMSVTKLGGKYTGIDYEVTYESQGIEKGVNSGSKPIDITGKDTFNRDVYLGTCSKNVCKPDTGVTKVSVALELTDSNGNKTQFSKDFPL